MGSQKKCKSYNWAFFPTRHTIQRHKFIHWNHNALQDDSVTKCAFPASSSDRFSYLAPQPCSHCLKHTTSQNHYSRNSLKVCCSGKIASNTSPGSHLTHHSVSISSLDSGFCFLCFLFFYICIRLCDDLWPNDLRPSFSRTE